MKKGLVKAKRRCFKCKKVLQGTPRHYYHVYYCPDCYPQKTCPTCGHPLEEGA